MNQSEAEGEALATRIAVALLLARSRNIDLENFATLGSAVMKTILPAIRPEDEAQAAALQDIALRCRESLDSMALLASTIRTHVLQEPDPT